MSECSFIASAGNKIIAITAILMLCILLVFSSVGL